MPDDAVAPRRMIRLGDFYADGRVSKSTALKWLREGKLRAYRVGGTTFVDETLDEFIERQAAARGAGEAA
jgi:excisionase family DNA binding protein